MSALLKAARNGQIKSVEQLIGAGADVNANDTNGFTATMYAACARTDKWKMTEVLIEAGADVN